MREIEWTSFKKTIEKAVKKLEKDCLAEAFFTMTESTQVAIRNSEILTQNRLNDGGVGFRASVKNRVGFACTNALTEESVMKTAEKAFTMARVSSEMPHFSLPEPGSVPTLKGYDPRVAAVTAEEAVDVAKRAITAAEEDTRVTAKDGRVVFESGWRGVINTVGVNSEERETRVLLYLGGIGQKNGEVTGICSESAYGRTHDLNPEKVGQAVREKVIHMFDPQKVKTFEGTVIFAPEAGSYQLTDVLIDALKGESVVAGRSAWTGKVGEKVAAESLTITDDPLLENGFSSRQFDDEGCPSQKTVLIEKGELETFLHHATSARALKTRNTGNASRTPGGFDMIRSIIGDGYRREPEVYPSNLVIRPGTKTKEQLVCEVEKGVLIESMSGFAQKGSGVISVQLSQAFFIEKGEIKYPIKEGMVSGVAFDWMNRISGMGNDAKQFGNAVVPSIRVEGVTIVGG